MFTYRKLRDQLVNEVSEKVLDQEVTVGFETGFSSCKGASQCTDVTSGCEDDLSSSLILET